MDDFKHVKQYAQEVQGLYTTRDIILDAMYDMYKLIWDEQTYVESRAQFMKVTKSPDPRNAVLGIIRLLTTTDPHYSVSYDLNDQMTMDVSSEIEKLAKILIDAAGRVRSVKVLREAVRSAAIFGEVIIGVTQTDDLVKNVKGSSPAIVERAERVAKMTPYLYEVYDPRTCYPIWDALGLRSFLHTSEVTAGEVIERFGADAEKALKSRRKRSITSAERIRLSDWWDLEQRVVWVDGGDEPVLQDKHGLPFIPYVCQVIEGSRMFRDPDEQRDPPLYTYYESGMWKRQCLTLTAIFQGIAAMGLNPQFIHEKGPTNEAVNRDFSVPGGVIEVPQGGKFYPMANKGIIDPATLTGLEIAERKGAESTIYRQVLGEPLGDVAFSYVSLMSQQGRLPLVSIQDDVGWAMADAALMAIKWMKLDKKKYKLTYAENSAEIDAKDIPDSLHLECKLEVSLPQDRLQMANIAQILVKAGIVDMAWVRENVLQISDPEEVDNRLMTEQTKQVLFGEWLKIFAQAQARDFAQEFMPELAGPQQPSPMGQPQPGMEQPGPMGVEGMEGGLPPVQAAGGGQAIPGTMGGMEPEQASGGYLE